MNNKNQKCLLCGEKAYLITSEQKGYKEPDIYKIYYCENCDTSFSIPRVEDTDEIYNLIYKYGEKVPDYDRYWLYSKEIISQEKAFAWLANKEPAYWGVWCAMNRHIKLNKSAKILEIGSGLGYLTYAMRKEGYTNAFGIDISNEAVNNAINKYGDFYICADVNEYAKSHINEYDVVLLTEVIEHIENPKSFLSSILHLLKDHGSIILTSPNKSFYPKEAIWINDSPPVHCWWFSENSFKYLAQELNLQATFINYSEYYKTHLKHLFDNKNSTLLSSNFIFDKEGHLISKKSGNIKGGVLPCWVKNTQLYKYLSRELYPFLFKSRFSVSKSRTYTQCIIYTK